MIMIKTVISNSIENIIIISRKNEKINNNNDDNKIMK